MKIKKPLLGLLVCASALLSVDKAYAATASVSEDANLRSDPYNTSSIVGTLTTGEQVEVLGTTGNWVEVSTQNGRGFIYRTFLNSDVSVEEQSRTTAQDNTQDATIASPVFMRSAADNNSEIVKTLSSGTPVKILNVEGNWYQISVENSQGYVYKTYLALDSGNSDTVFTNDATLDSSVKTLEDTEPAITYEDPNSGSNMDSDSSEDEQAAQEDNFSRSKSSSASRFTVYATTGINVRSKPSTSSSKIGSLSKGRAVKATALNNGWYTIIYNGRTGYISAQYASKTKPATISTSTVVYTTSALNVRSQPSTNSSKLGVLAKGTAITVKSSSGGWYAISYNGKTGYVNATYTTSSKPSAVAIQKPSAVTMYTTVGLNVRSGPSTSAQRLGTLPKGTAIKVTALKNNWYTTTYNGRTGYVSAQYVTSQKPSSVTPTVNANTGIVYTTARLNVRIQPSTTSAKLGVLDKGATVSTRNLSNGWYLISYNGKTGYISSQYTSKSKPNSSPSSANVSITEAIAIARRYIGYPYVWGGNGPDAYDCSGFTKMLYAKMGKTIPRTSYAQYSNCQKVSKSNLKAGDLVFFSTSTPISKTVSHVGFYIGNGYMIHAANTRQGIILDNINSNYYSQRYIGGGRY